MTAQKTLKEKSAEFNRLTVELETLKTAEANASEQLREAQEGLQEFDSLNNEVTRWRAEQVKARRDPRKLPDGLQKKMAAKEKAAEELSLAQGTFETIHDELASTKSRLDEMGAEMRECAIRVLESHGESIAAELRPLKLRVGELEQMLAGLQQLSFFRGGYTYPVGNTEAINDALSATGRRIFPHQADPISTMKRRWEGKLQAVIVNPDIPLDDLKPVQPSDYDD